MLEKIIPMIVIICLSTFFVNDEKSFYSWIKWCGLYVIMNLILIFWWFIMGNKVYYIMILMTLTIIPVSDEK